MHGDEASPQRSGNAVAGVVQINTAAFWPAPAEVGLDRLVIHLSGSWSWLWRAARPGESGSTRATRSRALIAVFSSMQSTTARSGEMM
jgi:transposase-like protein